MKAYLKFINRCQIESLALTGCSVMTLILSIYLVGGIILWPIVFCTIISPLLVLATYGLISYCDLTVFRRIGVVISQIVILTLLLTFVRP